MQIDTYVFVVWAQRSARSIFGAASKPVVRNGGLLCFKTEQKARAESDRLNAGSGGSYVRYSVRPIRVQMDRPSGLSESTVPHYAVPRANAPSAPAPRAA